MSKGYVVAEIEVTDPVVYDDYRRQVPATIAKYGGRYLVRGGDPERLEGDRPTRRWAVLEFASPERAREWYHSEDYAPVRALRLRSARTHAFLLTGHDAE